MNYGRGARNCAICGMQLERYGRYDQKTCSPKCRQALKRKRDKLRVKLNQGIQIIKYHKALIDMNDEKDKAIDGLKKLQSLINTVLSENES